MLSPADILTIRRIRGRGDEALPQVPEAVQRRRELLPRRRCPPRPAGGAERGSRRADGAVRARRRARWEPDRRRPPGDRTSRPAASVAVKLVAPAVVALPGVAQRLERELKQLERVQSAGVAKVLASGKRGDETWVAIELLEGAQTLAEAITARGPIALDQAAHLIEVIGEALIEAAQVGVVHRDLAPKNVLFAGQRHQAHQLLAAGADHRQGARRARVRRARAGRGQAGRSALEPLQPRRALLLRAHRSDRARRRSADEVHRAHVNGSITTPSSLAPVPAPVEAVIMRALDRSPTKRFLTVRQFVDEVGRVARGEVGAELDACRWARSVARRPSSCRRCSALRSGPTLMGAATSPAAATTLAGQPTGLPASAMVPGAPVVLSAAAGDARTRDACAGDARARQAGAGDARAGRVRRSVAGRRALAMGPAGGRAVHPDPGPRAGTDPRARGPGRGRAGRGRAGGRRAGGGRAGGGRAGGGRAGRGRPAGRVRAGGGGQEEACRGPGGEGQVPRDDVVQEGRPRRAGRGRRRRGAREDRQGRRPTRPTRCRSTSATRTTARSRAATRRSTASAPARRR